MTNLNPEELYEEYIEDVTTRCQNAIDYEKKLQEELAQLPLDILMSEVCSLAVEEDKYRKLKDKKSTIKKIKKKIHIWAYNSMFWNTKERQELFKFSKNKEKEIDNNKTLSKEEKENQKDVLDDYVGIKLQNLFDKLSSAEQQHCLTQYCAGCIARMRSSTYVRDIVQQILGKDTPIDSTMDKGNCTKALTSSLLKLEKKYDIKIFKNLRKRDIENILHPKELTEYLSPYIKKSETGFLKDIEDVKRGDIFLISWNEKPPQHAMMCYDFNKENDALLLGFSNNTINFNGFIQYDGITPLNGYIIDIKSLITDTIKGKNKLKPIIKLNPIDKNKEGR